MRGIIAKSFFSEKALFSAGNMAQVWTMKTAGNTGGFPDAKEKSNGVYRCSVLALSIFPGRRQPSIVDRNELNYRVRNGNGWTLILISTNSMSSSTARKQTILYCPASYLSRPFSDLSYITHRETSVSVSRWKRKSSGGNKLSRLRGSE